LCTRGIDLFMLVFGLFTFLVEFKLVIDLFTPVIVLIKLVILRPAPFAGRRTCALAGNIDARNEFHRSFTTHRTPLSR